MNENGKQLKGAFGKADKIVVSIFKYISYLSTICLVLIMLVAFFNVLGEKILHHGIPSSTEIIKYFHVPMVFLAGAFVTLDRGQTAIDLLYVHFPKPVQTICTVISDLLGAGVCAFVGYRGLTLMIGKHIKNHIMSSTTGIGFPLWPFSLMFSIGFFMLAFSFLWLLVRRFGPSEEVPEPEAPATEEGGADA